MEEREGYYNYMLRRYREEDSKNKMTKSKFSDELSESYKREIKNLNSQYYNALIRIKELNEEIQELKQAKKSKVKDEIEEEIGDVLFTIVNLCRFFDISPDNALRKSNYKFLKRFNGIEDELKKENKKFENI